MDSPVHTNCTQAPTAQQLRAERRWIARPRRAKWVTPAAAARQRALTRRARRRARWRSTVPTRRCRAPSCRAAACRRPRTTRACCPRHSTPPATLASGAAARSSNEHATPHRCQERRRPGRDPPAARGPGLRPAAARWRAGTPPALGASAARVASMAARAAREATAEMPAARAVQPEALVAGRAERVTAERRGAREG